MQNRGQLTSQAPSSPALLPPLASTLYVYVCVHAWYSNHAVLFFLLQAMEIASQRTQEERSNQDHVDEEVGNSLPFPLGGSADQHPHTDQGPLTSTLTNTEQ